ncbi:MAG: FAD synthetase family protein [Erysipelotrichaceae bacterium]|nr:FAD synthetase family protein [Erysipelotrichaceae bacterium]
MVRELEIHQDLPVLKKSVACIGYFDAVHLGHRQLLDRTIKESSLIGCDPAVICFEPDPLQVITGIVPSHILNYSQRIEKLQESGIRNIIVFRFDEDLMKMDAKEFICTYLNRMNLCRLICGYDFSFGNMGKGDPQLLREYGSFETIIIPEYTFKGEKVSSTRIKEALFRGDFSLAEELLGYLYYLDVKVVKCTENGSIWLTEAIPIDPAAVIPEDGSYKDLQVKDHRLFISSSISYEPGDLIRIRYQDYERTV